MIVKSYTREFFSARIPNKTQNSIDDANAARARFIAPLIGLLDIFVYVMREIGLSKKTSHYPVVDMIFFVIAVFACIFFCVSATKRLDGRKSLVPFEKITNLFCLLTLLHGSYFQVVDKGVVPFYCDMLTVYATFFLKPLPSFIIMLVTGFAFSAYRLFKGELIFTYAIAVFITCLISVYASWQNYGNFLEHENNQSKMEELVYKDTLTGALSLQGFRKRVEELLKKYPDTKYVISYTNIRNFKFINDRFGMDEGDKLLKFWVQKSMGVLSDKEAIARITGDRVAVLRINEGDKGLKSDGLDVLDSVRNFFIDRGIDYRIQLCSGIYILEEDDYRFINVDPILDCARLTQHKVKNTIIDGYAFYNPKQWEKDSRVNIISGHLRDAIRDGEITVWYQPQIDYSKNIIIGAEALCRWNHKTLGNISPGEFIGVLEATDQIYELDSFVWEEVCRHLQEWNEKGKKLIISVNLARNDIQLNRNIVEHFVKLVEKYRLGKEQLRIEITESSYMDDAKLLINTAEKLRECGFTVEMDDFGSGYSSLNMLKEVPVDIIKLDLKFLSNEGNQDKGHNIIGFIVNLVRSMEMEVIAEGVENVDQADFLEGIGCNQMQGYYFYKPLPKEDFDKLIIGGKVA